MSVIEAMWEVTVRILRSFVFAILVVLAGCLICWYFKYFTTGTQNFLPLASCVVLLIAVAFAAGLFAVGARYPTKDDHDVPLAICAKFMIIRTLQSAAVANLFLWIFYGCKRAWWFGFLFQCIFKKILGRGGADECH